MDCHIKTLLWTDFGSQNGPFPKREKGPFFTYYTLLMLSAAESASLYNTRELSTHMQIIFNMGGGGATNFCPRTTGSEQIEIVMKVFEKAKSVMGKPEEEEKGPDHSEIPSPLHTIDICS